MKLAILIAALCVLAWLVNRARCSEDLSDRPVHVGLVHPLPVDESWDESVSW